MAPDGRDPNWQKLRKWGWGLGNVIRVQKNVIQGWWGKFCKNWWEIVEVGSVLLFTFAQWDSDLLEGVSAPRRVRRLTYLQKKLLFLFINQ